MKKFVIISFIVLLLIYGGCALMVYWNLFTWDVYFKIAAIAGGLASIIGLGANAFIRVDLLSYDAEAIEKIADAAKEIENKQIQIKNVSNKIEALEYKKEELEVLVTKASLIMYYKQELNRLYEKLLKSIQKNEELNSLIIAIPDMESQLNKLESEMEKNPEIRDILNTIQTAQKRHNKKPGSLIINTILGSITLRV